MKQCDETAKTPCDEKPKRPGAPTDGKGMFGPMSDGKSDKEKETDAPKVTGIPKDGPNMAGVAVL